MMEWINIISNTDSVIYNMCIKDSCLIVYIKLWNDMFTEIKFLDYYGFKEKKSIGQEIGDVIIQTDSVMIDELRQDILNGDGELDEITNIKSVMFYNSWNEAIILEVLTKKIEFKSVCL